jgi:hypothetical protein
MMAHCFTLHYDTLHYDQIAYNTAYTKYVISYK